MRRAAQTLLIGTVLLTAACGTAKSSDTPAAQPNVPGASGAAAAPPADAGNPELRATCEALGKVYDKNMAPFAEALSKYVATQDKAAQEQAQVALRNFAAAVRTATKDSGDAQLRADGDKAAGQLTAKSKDKAFFAKLETSSDVNKVLGPTLKQWLSPVSHHCS